MTVTESFDFESEYLYNMSSGSQSSTLHLVFTRALLHTSKSTYRRVIQDYNLAGLWGRWYDHAFMALKIALSSEPVLRRPHFEGTPFIVTTDGCKAGFDAVLMQEQSTLPDRRVVDRGLQLHMRQSAHPNQKNGTNHSLLEFAALKFGMEKILGYDLGLTSQDRDVFSGFA
jgi:hypothetical protein